MNDRPDGWRGAPERPERASREEHGYRHTMRHGRDTGYEYIGRVVPASLLAQERAERMKLARELGQAQGKLEASEWPGIVDGWKDRATKAEAARDEYARALEEIREMQPAATREWKVAATALTSKEGRGNG